MSCNVGEATERLKNELCSLSNLSVTSPTSQLILQPFRRLTYVTAHCPTLPLLHLRHSSFSIPHSSTFPSLHLRYSSFSNPSAALPTSQLILQPFFRLSYVTGSSLTSPGEPPMLIDQLNSSFVLLLSLWCRIHSRKIIKL